MLNVLMDLLHLGRTALHPSLESPHEGVIEGTVIPLSKILGLSNTLKVILIKAGLDLQWM
jgi:hypothetical protein